jgi:hypothetical protein
VSPGSRSDLLNHWRALEYHDPAEILRRLRSLEVDLQAADIDPKVLSLRTQSLSKYREWRDAAVFSYGMGLAKNVDIGYAPEERSDYDFVTTWKDGDTQHFCAVQLKELVPENLNPTSTINHLLAGMSKYAKTGTVLAVKINRRQGLELREKPTLPFAQLWFFWASAPRSSRWCLYGDVLGDPAYFSYDYPQGLPLTHLTPEGWQL